MFLHSRLVLMICNYFCDVCSSIDLRNIAAGIYSLELCNRLRTFLVACPPTSPSTPVTDLLIATADFQRDVTAWGIRSDL